MYYPRERELFSAERVLKNVEEIKVALIYGRASVLAMLCVCVGWEKRARSRYILNDENFMCNNNDNNMLKDDYYMQRT